MGNVALSQFLVLGTENDGMAEILEYKYILPQFRPTDLLTPLQPSTQTTIILPRF